jgi:hypothetical protein
MRDRFKKIMGRSRFVVSRIFLHLAGNDVAPLLGVLNQGIRPVLDSDGDLETLGEALVEITESLLRYDDYWKSAANEGDVVWDEGEAGDYWTELFTDSAARYGSEVQFADSPEETLSLPVTRNVVVMITLAAEGEVPELETDLSNVEALQAGLKAAIALHYQQRLRGIQIHFSPAAIGEELTEDQILEYFPELIPL